MIPALIGVSSRWAPVLVLFGVTALLAVIWNVITVSLRQAVIPSHLLGRVNSVYRFFAWGMLPIGAAVGGGIVLVVEQVASREAALRAPWLACAAIHVVLVWIGRRHLTTAAIESARAGAAPDVSGPGDGATG